MSPAVLEAGGKVWWMTPLIVSLRRMFFQFSTAPLITSTGVWWARLAGRMDRRDEADGHVRQKSAELSGGRQLPAADLKLVTSQPHPAERFLYLFLFESNLDSSSLSHKLASCGVII